MIRNLLIGKNKYLNSIMSNLDIYTRIDNDIKLFCHFGYHKSMTNFFMKVFAEIAFNNNWYHKHHNSKITAFYSDANIQKKPAFISVNNVLIDFDKIPNFKGFHIIRDPRDLLISGYRYHLWCKEPWVIKKIDFKLKQRLKLQELGLDTMSNDTMSYQDLLKSVNLEMGLRLELNFRENHFIQMLNWNYENKNILEIRYEEVFNNETQIFKKIFNHYGFSPELQNSFIPIVKKYSFKEQKKIGGTGKGKHLTIGSTNQWKEKMPADILELFYEKHKNLILNLKYEF